MNRLLAKIPALLLTLTVGLIASSSAFATATIVIQNADAANVGFNDPSAPVPNQTGNSGTTLGEQRLIAFQAAANIWGATLVSGQTITIHASWSTQLTCGTTSGVLGSAGTTSLQANFTNAVLQNAWYSVALAEALALKNLNGATAEINAQFNSNVGTSTCLTSSHWYYGLDGLHGNGGLDLVTVLLHEFGHGLGFASFTDESTGVQPGTPPGLPSVFDFFLLDKTTGKHWPVMTNAERQASAINAPNLVWDGPQVTSDAAGTVLTVGKDASGHPLIYSINPVETGSSVSHWDKSESPNQLMEPSINSDLTHSVSIGTFRPDLTFSVLRDIGWCAGCAQPPPPSPTPTPSPPPNDNFASSQVIGGCSGSVTGSNILATKEAGEPTQLAASSGSIRSVWYQWQAPSTGSATITTSGSDFDTILSVYTGSSVGGLTLVPNGTNDDAVPGSDVTSSVTINVTQGTLYSIAVNGYDNQLDGGDTGNIKLNWSESSCAPPPAKVRLTATDFPINEGDPAGFVTIRVFREGDATSAASVNYATSDTAGLTVCSQGGTGKASERCDYATSLGTLSWAAGEAGTKTFNIPIINDAIVEGNETFNVTLSSPTGVSLGTPSTATVTILDDDVAPSTNPIDGVDFFITQQYIDFLGRMPDQGGFTNWHNTLAPCPNGGFGEAPTSDPTSNCDRLHVAAGFFQSQEFLDRGYFAFCFYMVSYNQRPTYAQFIPDMAQVGGPKSPAEEQASKAAFADAFVLRSDFVTKYPGLSGQPLANALWVTAGLPGSPINAGAMTNGQILRTIVETSAAFNKFLPDGTVAIQYFGFLRRDPDTIGYQNNLTTLRNDPNNLRHMIFIFIYSSEYRGRFGTP